MNISRSYLLLCLSFFLLAACAPQRSAGNSTITRTDDALSADLLHQKKDAVRKVLIDVDKRNREIETRPDWIEWAYQGIAISRLNDIPPERYKYYRQFVDNGVVYIFVHPSYYSFFHAKKPRSMKEAGDLKESIVDLFLHSTAENPVVQLEQEQQKNEKNFIEYLTTAEKLVILVLPRNYAHSSNYGYARSRDEYARYLNGIANGSPSILYMESESSSSGRLLSDDLIPLMLFLETVGAKTVLIAGGYVGRCQKEFYQYMTNFAPGSYSLVPEVSTFSPADLSEKDASRLIDSFKSDLQPFTDFVLLKTPGDVSIRHLSPEYLDAIIHTTEDAPVSELPAAGISRSDGRDAAPAPVDNHRDP
ncbi:MAG TPA: hypothetical protein VEP69_00090 [Thermodesulfovibrionales bacterium]|nr:hypothetical protein [Thermodesulfovibrionales bacterium]